MTDKTTTKYLVYYEDDLHDHFEVYDDLPTARTAASSLANKTSGKEFHVAAHLTTFRAETVVKETA